MSTSSPAPTVAGLIVVALISSLATPRSGAEGALAKEASPHLRQYADAPVAWVAWNDDAFAKATEEKKLIFVSIGYHACHWCRKMDEESFRDPALSKELNRGFICVKVDRLLRPDLDVAYRAFAQATGNSGGWPLNVWLTPAGNPVSVGSYFPTETTPGSSPGFKNVLSHISGQWSKHPKYVHEQSVRDRAKLLDKLKRTPVAEIEPPGTDLASAFYSHASGSFDPGAGGFDIEVKFPRHEVLEALCALAAREKPDSFRHAQIVKMVSRTLDGMLAGAIVDPLDGGIFRYANDPAWRVPQFEKMLLDQARFASSAIAGFQLTGNKAYAEAAGRALRFAQGALHVPAGGYCASLATDSETAGKWGHGAYYLWRAAELKKLLEPAEASAFEAAFGVRPGGNITAAAKLQGFDPEANILYAARPEARKPAPSSPLASAVAKVSAARDKRSTPPRDGTVITGWNGLMLSALSRAGKALGDPELLAAAKACAQNAISTLYDPETKSLARAKIGDQRVGDGFCEDYIFLARGLIDLHIATGDAGALQFAAGLQAIADQRFFDAQVGLYHLTPTSAKEALMPVGMWPISDGDIPSANATAALNQLDLAKLGGETAPERVSTLLRAMSSEAAANPIAFPLAILAQIRLAGFSDGSKD